MALVSLAELRSYMDISLTNRQQDAAELVLDGLQSELEAYLRRPIEIETFNEEYTYPSTDTGIPMDSFFKNSNPYGSSFYSSSVGDTTYLEPPQTIYLRNSPVVTVTEVIYKPLMGNERELVEGVDFLIRRYGIDVFRAFANDTIEVTYTAGLNGAGIPMFKLMILRAATREMQNMHDDVVGIKDLEARNVAPMQTGFLETELMALKKFRRNRIA
jgi:hypothetical protein